MELFNIYTERDAVFSTGFTLVARNVTLDNAKKIIALYDQLWDIVVDEGSKYLEKGQESDYLTADTVLRSWEGCDVVAVSVDNLRRYYYDDGEWDTLNNS